MSLHHPSPNSLNHDFVFDRDRQEALQDELRNKLRSRSGGGGGGLGPNPASGGGGGGGSSSPASGGGNSQSNGGGSNGNNAEDEPQEAQQPVEEEQEEIQEELVSLTNAKFIIPESEEELDKTVGIDKEIGLEVDVEYLTDRKPSSIQFKISLEHDGVVEDLPIVNGTVSGGKATAKAKLLMHNGFYSKANKADGEKYVVKLNTLCDADGAECVGTNEVELPRKQKQIFMVEIHSDVFPHDNLIPCLDTNATLIDSLATAFRHVGHYDDVEQGVKGADHELVVHGHASTLSDSEVRAKAIKTLVEDRRSNWSTICTSYGTIKDYQQSLKVLSDSYGWDCDPGSVDGDDGAKTIAAIMGFQRTYNSSNGGQQDLLIDGEWGPKCWKGLFNTIRSLALYLSQVDKSRIKTRFHSKVDGVLPCATAFPKSETGCPEYKSSTDERVELLYFPKPNPPVLATPASDAVTTQEAGAYDQALCDIEVVPYDGIDASGLDRIDGITIWTENDKGEKRVSSNGELNIVPPNLKQKVFIKAQTSYKSTPIGLELNGEDNSFFSTESIDLSNHQGNFSAPSAGTMRWDRLIPMNGKLEPTLTPKIINITTTGSNPVTTQLNVWPNNEEAREWNLAKNFSFFKSMAKKIPGAISWLPGADVEFTALVGKVEAKGAFSEVSNSHEVFYAFSVNGGFKPLIAAKIELSVSAWNLVGLPDSLMKYIADIKGGVEFEGKIGFTIEVARTGISDYKGSGGVSGSIGINFFLSALIANGKVLEAKAAIGSGIEAKSRLGLEAKNKCKDWSMELNSDIEFGFLKGEISWTVFDGMWASKNTCTLYEGKKWTADPIKLF
ncbi:MAG: peptidoglycan-binding protein [Fibrobacterales bacterium]